MLEYYVDQVTGNDDNDGTKNNPFKTLAKLFSILYNMGERPNEKCYVYLSTSWYQLDFSSLVDETDSLNKIKNYFKDLYFIGKGIDTVLCNRSLNPNNNASYSGSMCVHFIKLKIVDNNPSNSYIFLPGFNQYYENVVFADLKPSSYGHFCSIEGCTTYIKNCTVASGCEVDFSITQGGNVYIEDSYGKFTLRDAGIYASNYHITNSVLTTESTNNATNENEYLDEAYRSYGVYGGNHKWGTLNVLLVENSGKYYTIEENNLVEITEEISHTIIEMKGTDMYKIMECVDLIPDEFKLISINDFKCSINNVQTTSQLIVASNNFSTKIAENIDYFKAVYEKNVNSYIKVAFSIDNGLTWKGNNFEDLSVEIPLKPYSELSEEERTKWNTAKENIAVNGIQIEDLESLNFNTLDFEHIRFAYVLSITNADDICNTTQLQWQFDAKGSMQLMDSTEVGVEVLSDSIRITPKTEEELIKVNITNGTCSGLENPSQDETLTDEEIKTFVSGILS